MQRIVVRAEVKSGLLPSGDLSGDVFMHHMPRHDENIHCIPTLGTAPCACEGSIAFLPLDQDVSAASPPGAADIVIIHLCSKITKMLLHLVCIYCALALRCTRSSRPRSPNLANSANATIDSSVAQPPPKKHPILPMPCVAVMSASLPARLLLYAKITPGGMRQYHLLHVAHNTHQTQSP